MGKLGASNFLTVEELQSTARMLERLIAADQKSRSLRLSLASTRRLLAEAKERRAAALADLAAWDGETL
jgi:hypothetical protein